MDPGALGTPALRIHMENGGRAALVIDACTLSACVGLVFAAMGKLDHKLGSISFISSYIQTRTNLKEFDKFGCTGPSFF